VAAALNVLDGADHVARFLVGAARKAWREDFTLRFGRRRFRSWREETQSAP
jgi:hypothetical protein